MQNIEGDDKTVEVLLSGPAFGIDYYQREYRWKRKQVQEFIDDLHGQFIQTWNSSKPDTPLEEQSKYFLGSIVISKVGDTRNIVDGQQRITTLTLLLIYLNHRQSSLGKKVKKIESLIYDEDPSGYQFKLNISERNDCMHALLNGQQYIPEDKSESVKNLIKRYEDLDDIFPKDMKEDALYMFIWWIIRNVKIIEIVAHDDGDAYTIFETMNDRGLSLSPTEMLRGYLLANINDSAKRNESDKLIKDFLSKFSEYGKETDADFFKTWLRAQYATKIRKRTKNANPKDFELIGTQYHRWLRNQTNEIGLRNADDFYEFVNRDFRYFASLYIQLLDATKTRTSGIESVRYNADSGFTLQHHVSLAAVTPKDDKETANTKVGVVTDFLDCWLNLRLWNYKSNSYASMQYAIFQIILKIRRKSTDDVRKILRKRLLDEMNWLNFENPVRLNQFTSRSIHRQLARFVDWLERESGNSGNYENYVIRSGKVAYEIEHIWADRYDRFKDEFSQQNDFDNFRNNIGGLLLLPKKINASLSDKTYEEKLPHYIKENCLAQSLHESFYLSNPGFLQTVQKFNLLFQPHSNFTQANLEKRSKLYCHLAKLIWSPKRLLKWKKNITLYIDSRDTNKLWCINSYLLLDACFPINSHFKT